MKKLRVRLRTSFLGYLAGAYKWTPTIRLHQKLASREPDIYRMCSLPLLHFVLFLRKRQSRIKWADTIFFFFKEKQVPKTALRPIQIFIPIFSPPRSTGSGMKIDTQAGDPKAEFSTRKQGPSQTCGSVTSRSRKQTIRRTEIYLQELKAKGICFNLSSLCTGWPKSLFRIFQSSLWPTWSLWPTQ